MLGRTRGRRHNGDYGSTGDLDMSLEGVAEAMKRVRTVLERRPDMGPHDDAPATARWEQGTRIVASHANGASMQTDMPRELGGSGDRVSPGWMFRAGVASCYATMIAMNAAERGIALTELEVKVSSRSDTRGFLGMPGESGAVVSAQPFDVQFDVRIAARNADDAKLRQLVEESRQCSPMPTALALPTPAVTNVVVA